MRKLILVAGVCAAALVVAAVAIAATQTTYRQRFLSNRVATVAGMHLAATAIDPDNRGGNRQPAPPRELDLSFPAGTRIDTSAAPICGHFDPSLADPCPPNTRVASGTAEMREKFPGSEPITASVTAYNRKHGLSLFVVPDVSGQDPVLLPAALKGLTLVTTIPKQCVESDCPGNGEAVLTKLTLDMRRIRRAGKAYLSTPRTCPKAGWRFRATFRFEAPTPAQSSTVQQACRK